MKLVCCSVYDAAVMAFMPPFFTRSKGEAIRSFADAVGDAKSPFCAHPKDFTLFVVSTFDDSSGMLEQFTSPLKLITALECIAATAERS